jgi:dolichol-phosphate mannosyltransferase
MERNYDYIFEMDADLSHDPNDLVRMYIELQSINCDVVIGSRYVNGINVVNWPLSRIMLSYFASIYSRIITGLPVKDATSGFVGFKREVLEKMNLSSILFNGYAFQIELKFKAYKNNFKILEIPIIFRDRVHGESKMSGNIIFEAVFGLIKLKIKSFLN